ncbi:DUF4194 domain-containing protein [Dyella caseinilytica]|uniref:DUF4194 domain-containing protein n=1 Tax=Dyella caseinilytica TaxID=1849581 RepID=A0ABX7GYB0_9GAMM|nr:DUF4194 domain-containing protein [Dyella caseinilytica]QRN54961.1 DUF4194 domain-containing protein [Dyella caseinilytica]GFZ98254.1 hypothetical protein GCM10011408_18560 [Dyella caseinilytica]
MNLLEDDTALVEAVAEKPKGGTALFDGDSGSLPLDARRALCLLLAGPSLDAGRYSQLWTALLRHEAALRSRLCDLFLELVIDREGGVAFTRQFDTGELDTPVLLRTSPLTFIDSVLLLYLRQQLAEAEAHGHRAVVEEASLVDALSVYEKSVSTDRAGFAKRVAGAITKMKDNHVLDKLRGSDDRYEVSPALKLLFSAEDVQALAQAYRELREADEGQEKPDGE